MSRMLQEFLFTDNPEQVLRDQYAARIAEARARWDGSRHRPSGPRLKLLLAGYSGACNTGADVRTGEIIRQIRALMGADRVALGALTVGRRLPEDWGDVQAEAIVDHPPDFVHDLCTRYDAVVVCEGSLFTSTFSDGLAALLTAFLGMAVAQGKPAVALGVEADVMTPATEAFVRDQAGGALLIARNAPSCERLAALGLTARQGTDTGWTFSPRPVVPPQEILRAQGWDGRAAVLALCPVNPFRWPLAPDPQRALILNLEGRRDPDHYGGFSFFQASEEVERRTAAFLDAITAAVRLHARRVDGGVFPVIVGMEALDRPICLDLAARLDAPAPMIAGETDPHTLIAVLRAADRLISARYHAVLLTIGAGVPSVGLAYDQRIPALMSEAGRPDLALSVNDPSLAQHLAERLDALASDGGTVSRAFTELAARQRMVQEDMGRLLVSHLTGTP